MMMALSVAPTVAFAQAPDSEGEARRVVILNATDPCLLAFLALDHTLRKAIRARSTVPTR
jgi:hypothetical protein